MKHSVSVLKSLDWNLLKKHIILPECETGELLKIPLQSAISLETPTFASRTVFGKSDQHHISDANFLQISFAILPSLKGVAFQMSPLNDHFNGEVENLQRFHPFKGLAVCLQQISCRLRCKQNLDRIALEFLRCIDKLLCYMPGRSAQHDLRVYTIAKFGIFNGKSLLLR
jgi:hypothetical protein